MLPSGAGYPQRRKGRCGVGGGLLHERLLAIEFLDYSFKTMFFKVFFLRCLHHLFMFGVYFCYFGYFFVCLATVFVADALCTVAVKWAVDRRRCFGIEGWLSVLHA